MSIATLKKKSKIIKSVSGKENGGFSLNGGHRNIRPIGADTFTRSTTFTRFRGNTPIGSGGCCGTYNVNINNSGKSFTNDSSIIKKSTLNNSGLISHAYPWLNGQWPHYIVQSNFARLSGGGVISGDRSQSDYIKLKSAAHSECVIDVSNAGLSSCVSDCKVSYIGAKKIYRLPYSKNYNTLPLEAGMYTKTKLLKTNCLPTPLNKAPFPFFLNNNGCNDIVYNSVQEAIDAGALPSDHIGEQSSASRCCR